MKAIQFWILMLGSFAITGLQIKAVYVSRALGLEQSMVDDSKATAATQPAYENAWKQLSLHIYQMSSADPALQKVLKDNKIEITAKPVPESKASAITAPSAATPTPAPVPVPPAARQSVGPMHP